MKPIIDPEDTRLAAICRKRIVDRTLDELMGACGFALQDGHISQGEAESILSWLKTNEMCLNTWPADVLYDRLSDMLADGVLDDSEQQELLALVLSISKKPTDGGASAPASLPLDEPYPAIVFENSVFCFTGVFDYGSRSVCENAVQYKGAKVGANVTGKTTYLVIGNVGSEYWRHSSFGRKIEKAIALRADGGAIAIVSELHWRKALDNKE